MPRQHSRCYPCGALGDGSDRHGLLFVHRCPRSLGPRALAASDSSGGRATGLPPEPASLAERIDLTRITVLQVECARAAREKKTAELAAYEAEIVAMLQDEVLPYARSFSSSPGAGAGGTGLGTAGSAHEAPVAPAVAVDEEEIGAASLEAKLVELASELISLEGETGDESLEKKLLVLEALRGMSERAHFGESRLDEKTRREAGQSERLKLRMRKEAEAPPGSDASPEGPPSESHGGESFPRSRRAPV